MKLNFVILPILFVECNSFGFKFHTFLGERLTRNQAKTLVRKIAENTKLEYNQCNLLVLIS
jgi:hypothetical protein